MNRAMVVNEVTIAQSVSLRSWAAYPAPFKLPFSVEVLIKNEAIPVKGSAPIKANASLSDGTKLSADPNFGGSGVRNSRSVKGHTLDRFFIR